MIDRKKASNRIAKAERSLKDMLEEIAPFAPPKKGAVGDAPSDWQIGVEIPIEHLPQNRFQFTK